MAVSTATSEHPSTMSRASATARLSKRQAYSSSATRLAALDSRSGRPTSTVAAASTPEASERSRGALSPSRQSATMAATSASWAAHACGRMKRACAATNPANDIGCTAPRAGRGRLGAHGREGRGLGIRVRPAALGAPVRPQQLLDLAFSHFAAHEPSLPSSPA